MGLNIHFLFRILLDTYIKYCQDVRSLCSAQRFETHILNSFLDFRQMACPPFMLDLSGGSLLAINFWHSYSAAASCLIFGWQNAQ